MRWTDVCSRKVIFHLGLGILFLILFNWALIRKIPKRYLIGGLSALLLALAAIYQIPQVKDIYGPRLLALVLKRFGGGMTYDLVSIALCAGLYLLLIWKNPSSRDLLKLLIAKPERGLD
jgi:hypothetical protein